MSVAVPVAIVLAVVRQGAGLPLLLASLTGWFILAAVEQRIPLTEICAASIGLERLWVPPIGATGYSALAMPVVASFAMVLAMMAPLLTVPMTHLWIRSLARRRLRAIALFSLAYAAVWTLAMTLLAVASAGLLALGIGRLAALALALVLAALWQSTPARQGSLNRCHRLPRLGAFGWAADRDCLAYGFTSGLWCVGACWALMLLPMFVERGHFLAMLAVMAFLLIERQMPSRAVRWRMPFAIYSA
jgi:predicted metal-binding membrane protein